MKNVDGIPFTPNEQSATYTPLFAWEYVGSSSLMARTSFDRDGFQAIIKIVPDLDYDWQEICGHFASEPEPGAITITFPAVIKEYGEYFVPAIPTAERVTMLMEQGNDEATAQRLATAMAIKDMKRLLAVWNDASNEVVMMASAVIKKAGVTLGTCACDIGPVTFREHGVPVNDPRFAFDDSAAIALSGAMSEAKVKIQDLTA